MSMKYKNNVFIIWKSALLRCASLSVIAVVVTQTHATAVAQENSSIQPASGAVMEEIVVTARKKAENLQRVPIAVSAYSGDKLNVIGATNITEISRFTPGLSLDAGAPISGSSASVTAYIRGVGQNDFNLTIDPGVGIYLDGVYISRSVGGLLDTVDIESIEVLRGPQGTLFGKNTVGGAISITSRAPSDTFNGSSKLIVGSDRRVDISSSVDVPITDNFILRLTGSSTNQDGYVDLFQFDDEALGDRNRIFGRAIADWTITDNLDIRFSIDGTSIDENTAVSSLLQVRESAIFPVFNNIFLNGPTCAPGVPGREADLTCYTASWITDDPHSTNLGTNTPSKTKLWGGSVTASWDAGAFELKSITAYRDLESTFGLDTDNSPIPIVLSLNDYTQDQFSQELQFSGGAMDGRVDWLVGLFYLEETGKDINQLRVSPVQFQSGGSVDNESYAAFVQVNIGLTDNLGVTLGGRYTKETKAFTPNQLVTFVHPAAQAPLPPGSPFPFFLTNPQTTIISGIPQPLSAGDFIVLNEKVEVEANEFTPSISLDYALNDNTLVYASFSEGFKSGGFTQRLFPPEAPTPANPTLPPPAPSFDPEFVKAYEIGLKTVLLENRLRWNSAIFWSDYTDLQIIVADGFAPKVRNAGAANLWGIESEFQAVVSDRFQLEGSVAYLRSEYDEVDPAAAPVTLKSDLVNAPEWTASLGVDIEIWSGRTGHVNGRADLSYRGAHFKDAINTAVLEEDGYTLFSASLTYTSDSENWSVTLGGRNLGDAEYLSSGYADLNFVGAAYGSYGRPREWYLSFTANY